MARAKSKRNRAGVGAIGSIKTRWIHPSAVVRAAHPLWATKQWQSNHETKFTLIGFEDRVVGKGRKAKPCYLFRSNAFPGTELHATVVHFKISETGHVEEYFDRPTAAAEVNNEAGDGDEDDDDPKEMPVLPVPGDTGFAREEIENMIDQGIMVDDDNAPAPENIPPAVIKPGESVVHYNNSWGHNGSCYRLLGHGGFENPRMLKQPGEDWSRGDYFRAFFPMDYMKAILLDINRKLPPSQHHIEYWEFLWWIGIWFLLATVDGHARKDFWDRETVDRRFAGAPFTVHDLMTMTRFNFITNKLYYTLDPPPTTYRDKFHAIRALQDAWNENMTALFMAGWLVCLDESMSKWINQWTCPGFVFCPRKPWPFGNEWHTIACSICTIIFFVELVEGKDRPKGGPPREFSDKSKTVGLVLRMTRPIWHRAKCVILDSGFCVLKAIIEPKISRIL